MYLLAGPAHDRSRFPELAPVVAHTDVTMMRHTRADLAVAVVERGPWSIMIHGSPRGGDATGVVLDAVEHGAFGRLAALDGSFAVIAHHRGRRASYAATDRHATLRLFYAADAEQLAVFPRVHYFRRIGRPLAVTRDLTLELLSIRGLLRGGTPIAGVRRVPPGTVVEHADGRTVLHRYWTWQFREDGAEDAAGDLLPELRDRFTAAVDEALRDRETCIAVSGGLDSRAVLAMAARRRGPTGLETVTFGSPGTLDFEIGVRVGRRYAAGATAIRLDADPAALVDRLAEQCVETDGCVDLVNAAHPGFGALPRGRRIVVGALGDKLTGKRVTGELAALAAPATAAGSWPVTRAHLLGEIQLGGRRWLPRLLGMDPGRYAAAVDAILGALVSGERSPYAAVSTFDVDVVNPVFELTCIAKHGELRSYGYPFLDRRMVEFWCAVPPALRRAQTLYLSFLAREFAEAYAIPLKNHDGASLDGRRSAELDAALGEDRHVNYVRWGALLRDRGPVAAYVRELLAGTASRGLVDGAVVAQLVAEHETGAADHSLLLLRIATLEQIARAFGAVT